MVVFLHQHPLPRELTGEIAPYLGVLLLLLEVAEALVIRLGGRRAAEAREAVLVETGGL
jgi:hypothetical protein